jgi:hypothetical protein
MPWVVLLLATQLASVLKRMKNKGQRHTVRSVQGLVQWHKIIYLVLKPE